MKVGEVEILPVLDGVLVSRLPSTKPLPDPQSWLWEHQGGMFRPDGMKESSLGGFLVRTGDRLVLVDAGAGPALAGGYTPPVVDVDDPSDTIAGFFRDRGVPEDRMRQLAGNLGRIELTQGELPASLAGLGVRPEEVTDLVFTHLHFDHIGWASVDNAPYFPNATIRCAAADLDYFLGGPQEDWFSAKVFQAPLVPDRLQPILDRIETWETDSTLFAGIDVRLTPGHTPGSSVVVVSSGPDRAMLLGDIVHCPLELQDDDFNFLGDHDQVLANRVREAYARELEGSGIAAAAAHFPGLRFGRLLPGQGLRSWTFDRD
jgi:glyoxylase-like metal-dependent hydrolase (beta-lactamase superfamily II)